MTALNTDAVETLASAGLTVTDWARHNHMTGEWIGDACGCPDSRCIGFHHDGPDDCACLPALLKDAVVTPAPAVEAGQIWHDTRDRWLRVDEIVNGKAVMVVVAQKVGDRVMAPMRGVSVDAAKVPKRMVLVDAAPTPTGPDLANLTIDYRDQTIVLGNGPVPYYVGSSGLVTVTFYAGAVRTIYGGA
ncbi:hypothetical protein [Nocardia sp. NPDC055049]